MNKRIRRKKIKEKRRQYIKSVGIYPMSSEALSVYAMTGFKDWLPFYEVKHRRFRACVNGTMKTQRKINRLFKLTKTKIADMY